MTNEKIIEMHRQALIEAGIITANEAIHTFEAWKHMGYSVKRGEKSITRFSIWKKGNKMRDITVKTDDGKEEQQTVNIGNFFMKDSCFFASRQVEAIRV